MTERTEAEKLIKIIRPYTPEHLYKYRTMNSREVENIFTKREIYLSDATKFDDPFECRPVLIGHKSSLKKDIYLRDLTRHKFPDADKKEIKKLMKGKKALLSDQSTLKNAYENFVKTVGIYCLSEINDNLIMWSLYSDSHRGFCLEFDSSIQGTLFWESFKVIYSEVYPAVNIMDIGKAEEFRKALLTKFVGWKNQIEWRIIKMEQEGGPGLYRFSPALLTGVIFGALMTEKHKATIRKWIEEFPAKINLYQARLNENKYQVDIVTYSGA
jgi:hypothetical protein